MFLFSLIFTLILHAQVCPQALESSTATQTRQFFQAIEGDYQIGPCEVSIQVRNECRDQKEWLYAEVYVKKQSKEYLMNFALSENDTTADYISINDRRFYIRDHERYPKPSVYESFSIAFSPNKQNVGLYYKKYIKSDRPYAHREYLEKLFCQGANPFR